MKRVSRAGLLLAILAILVFAAGCARHNLRFKEPKRDDVSLVFGYLDMSEAPPGVLSWVRIKQLQLETDRAYRYCSVDKGMFWNSHLPPASYKFTGFGGMTRGREFEYSFGQQGQGKLDLAIKKPGIYYVGSYRVKITKKRVFGGSEYTIEPIESPSEKELLERLLVYAGETHWKKHIIARLEELK